MLIWMSSCGKRQGVETISTYSFTNTLNYRVTFDVYGSKEDYGHNANIISKHFIEAGSTIPISFDAPKTYWVDWYTVDYAFNNWGPDTVTTGSQSASSNNAFPTPKIDIASEPDKINIRSVKKDTSMSVLLNGNGVSSTWQVAIAAGAVPALIGTHTFLFKKDFSGQYTFTDLSGQTSTQPFKYTVRNIQSLSFAKSFIVTAFDAASAPLATFDFFVDADGVASFGRDTLEAYFNQLDISGFYRATRQ